MTAYFYLKVVHLLGIMMLFLAMGGIIATDKKKPVMVTKFAILHGVALLILFLTGFAMQGMGKLGFPTWLIVKIVIWFLFGGALVLLKREVLTATRAWIVVLIMGTATAWLAVITRFGI